MYIDLRYDNSRNTCMRKIYISKQEKKNEYKQHSNDITG